jgi:hypothetical protein
MPDSPAVRQRLCPSCGAPFPSGYQAACSSCGFAPAAGIVRRDPPQQTRGLEAIARRFGTRWCFGGSLLAFVVIAIYWFDISEAEATGKSFSSDMFTGAAYRLGGKWSALAFWFTVAVLFFLAGLKARKIDRDSVVPASRRR